MFQEILLFSLLSVITMISGGVLVLYKKPTGNIRSLILHFAAGVVFSVVAVELLPDIIREHKPFQVIIGFTAGVGVMLLIRKFTEAKLAMDELKFIKWRKDYTLEAENFFL